MQEEQKKPDHEIQKMSWTELAKFDDYADALKMKLAEEELDKPTKIRRRQNGFSVMNGEPVKKAKKVQEPVVKKKRPPQKKDRKARKKHKK